MNIVRCPIVELRQYALHPGQREALIALFDREFVESQEELGMAVLGQFRDLDNRDRFVWLRGFETMPGRAKALASFYSGPAWRAHSAGANATMIDSDNVLLLRPVSARSAFPAPGTPRPPAGHTESPTSLVLATIYYRDRPFDDGFLNFFDRQARPGAGRSGSRTTGLAANRVRREHVSRVAGTHGRARVRVVRAVLQRGAGGCI